MLSSNKQKSKNKDEQKILAIIKILWYPMRVGKTHRAVVKCVIDDVAERT